MDAKYAVMFRRKHSLIHALATSGFTLCGIDLDNCNRRWEQREGFRYVTCKCCIKMLGG
jgi:hypothetical protein